VRVVILGASGHGRVVAECAQANGTVELAGFLEIDPKWDGTIELGLPVHGPHVDAATLGATGVLLGTGNNQRRLHLLAQARQQGLALPTLIHPRAHVSPSAHLGDGTVVMANATVQTCCRVGAAVIVNTNASVDHDCVVGDGVHISPGAHLAGNVTVGEGTHIGIGATVIEGIRIGARCLVAAGAVVVRDVPDDMRVAGVPARPMTTR
jgi:sugar O-acyltransferase (sialic acid O-acetyltransferase NeuD family)